MLRSSTVLLFSLSVSAPAILAAAPLPSAPPRLQASCLGAPAAGAPARLAVRWSGAAPILLEVWGDADGDRRRAPDEELVATRLVAPGFSVIELERAPEAAIAVGPADASLSGIAALLAEGCAWSPEFFRADLDGVVRAFAVYDDGSGAKLYVAGEFLAAGDRAVNRIAAWDGAAWTPLVGAGGIDGANGSVHALLVYAGSLYVGGAFSEAGGIAAAHLARWSAAGWSNVGDFDGSVHALASLNDPTGTRLYVGGSFQHVGDLAVSNIARRSGTTWETVGTAVGSVPGVSGPVYALERCTDGGILYRLFVGGDFDSSSGGVAHNIARWNGSTWSSVGSGAANGVSDAVRALECKSGVLYVGGEFDYAGNAIFSQGIASWSGSAWSALGSGMFFETGDSGQVLSLAFYDDGTNDRLYAGGNFHYAGGQPAHNLAAWTGSGWTGMIGSSMTGMDGAVLALGEFGGELHAGGWFVEAGGARARHVARWSGSSAEPWRPLEGRDGWAFDDSVTAWAVYDEGEGPRLFAGGFFTHVGPVAAKYLARWDGEQWSEVSDPASGGALDYVVETLLVHDDGAGAELFVGGAFNDPGRHIVAWTGSGWRTLGAPGVEGVDGWVNVLASYPPGPGADLYVGGDFEEAGGIVAEGLARWDGAAWSHVYGSISPVAYVQGGVGGLAVFDGGGGPHLYVGGIFEIVALNVHNLARWNGSNWGKVGTTEPDGFVLELAVHDDGSGPALYAGGLFTHIDGLEANRVARWSGSAWSALTGPAGNGVDGEVWSFGTYDDGGGEALYVGGNFTTAGGLPTGGVARWDGSAWSSLPDASGSGLDGAVFALLSYDDGRGPALWAGGSFLRAGARPSSNAGRWSCGLLFKDGFESASVGAWDFAVGVPGGPS